MTNYKEVILGKYVEFYEVRPPVITFVPIHCSIIIFVLFCIIWDFYH